MKETFEELADKLAETGYVSEAVAMLGAGYEPAAVIEQPTKKLVLTDGLDEVWSVAWVKLSTAFKPHIKQLHGSPLAVWLFISLSINKDGIAFPGIRTIAAQTGYSHQGVIDAIKILEEKGYLKVRRGERKFNLYEPEFAAIGRANEPKPSVKLVDSSAHESSFTPDESTFSPNESSGLDLNKKNKKEQEPIFSEKDKKDMDTKFNYILEHSKTVLTSSGKTWRGRELLPENYISFGDWWHSKTGLHMYGPKGKAKIDSGWMKAFKDWYENDIDFPALEKAFAEASWRTITTPAQITELAKAEMALRTQKKETPTRSFPQLVNGRLVA